MIRKKNGSARKQLLQVLYGKALPAKRTGALFGAFPYPTKISPEAIALFIAAHTDPGDTVFDGFAGSGTTGLAALLCGNPTSELLAEAERIGLNVQWGPRDAVLYELGVVGALVADTLSNPPDPTAFQRAAEELVNDVLADVGWMYEAPGSNGERGVVRHVIWTNVLVCPACAKEVTLWDACVSLRPASISSVFICPRCRYETKVDEVQRATTHEWDDLLGDTREFRDRRIARVDGRSGTRTWSRTAVDEDQKTLVRIASEPIPSTVPRGSVPWGDLYRRGYHAGISHVHHFYTRRNLIVFAKLWEGTSKFQGKLCDGLRFWLLSYNAAHATIMTRVVAKSGQNDLVVTSAQPGVLYVSGLPVEKNLIAGLKRKLATITMAFRQIHAGRGKVTVRQASSAKLDLPDKSIDYVFTDPPFGGNIPYAEVNFLNESWLGRLTNVSEEITVSNHQKKSIYDYQILLTSAFEEVNRILKPDGMATVVFHSTSSKIWRAFQTAYKDAGFSVELATVLDKTQGSFKQVTTRGSVHGDPVLLLNKRQAKVGTLDLSIWDVAQELRRAAEKVGDPEESTPQRLYSRLVMYYLERHMDVPIDAHAFYLWNHGQDASESFKGEGN